MSFHFDDFCASAPAAIRICFRSADFSFSYRFLHVIPKLVEIGPTRLLAGDVYLNVPQIIQTRSKNETKRSTKPFELPLWSKQAKLLPTQLEIKRFQVENSPKNFKGDFKLSYEHNSLIIGTTTQLLTDQRKLGDASIDMRALIQQHGEQFDYQFSGTYHTRLGSGTIETKGAFKSDGIQGTFQQRASIPKDTLPRNFPKVLSEISNIELSNCRYAYLQTQPSEERGLFELYCPIYLKLPRWKLQNLRTLAHLVELTDRPLIKVVAHLSVPFPPNSSESSTQGTSSLIHGRITISPGTFLGPLIKTSGILEMNVSVIPSEHDPMKNLNGVMQFSGEIPEFQALVQRFSGTPLSIPSPLNTLHGFAQLNLSGIFTLSGGSLSINGNSRLSSPLGTQRVFGDITGTTIVDTRKRPLSITTNANIVLSDLHIGLPKLSLGKLPQILPDSRITENRPIFSTRNEPKLVHHYKVQVKTTHPLQIESNFTSTPIPIDLNLTIQNPEQLSGSITIQRFPISLLGGKKEVRQINVKMDIQGFHNVPQGEVTVNTDISTTEITAAQLAGQVAGAPATATSRSAPTFQIPFMELVSSLLLGTPLNEVISSPSTSSVPPESLETSGAELIDIRKRF